MKTSIFNRNLTFRSVIDNSRKSPAIPALGAAVLLAISSATNAMASENQQPFADEITRASVVYQPIMWIGETPPGEAENRALHADVEKMKQLGVGPAVPDLETFLATYPGSPWAPSLRANLGQYYYDNMVFLPAHFSFGNWHGKRPKMPKTGRPKRSLTSLMRTGFICSQPWAGSIRCKTFSTRLGRVFLTAAPSSSWLTRQRKDTAPCAPIRAFVSNAAPSP